MKHSAFVACWVLLLCTACGAVGTASSPTPASPTPAHLASAYLYQASNNLIFLDFADGIVDNITIQKSSMPPYETCVKTLYETDLVYTINGNEITIQALFVDAFGPYTILADGTIVHNHASENGAIVRQVFSPVSASDYNQALAKMRDHLPDC